MINYVAMTILGLFETGSWWEAIHNANEKSWPMLKDGYTFWPPATFVNYYFVPS